MLCKVLTAFGLEVDRGALFSLAEMGKLIVSPLQAEVCLGNLQGLDLQVRCVLRMYA